MIPNAAPLTGRLVAVFSGLPRTFWYLWGGIFINRIGNFVLPFLAIYLTTQHGFSIAAAGLAVAAYGAGGIVATLVGGTLADRIGRRQTLLFSLFTGPLVLMGLPFARQPALLFVLIFLVGTIYELYRPAANAAISDVVPAADRQRAFSLVYWVINLGFAIGVSLAGLLVASGYLWLFIGDAVTTFIYGIVVYLKVPETKPQHTAHRSWLIHSAAPFKDGVFTAFITLSFALACVFNLSFSMLPIEMTNDGLSSSQYGQVIALNGVLIVCLQPIIANLAGRFHAAHVLAVAALVVGIGFGSTAFVSTALGYAGTLTIWTLAEMAWLPLAPAMVASLSPTDLRGAYQGAYGLSWALATSIGPSLGGLVFDHFGSTTLWTSCIVIGAISSLGFLLLGPAIRRAARRLA